MLVHLRDVLGRLQAEAALVMTWLELLVVGTGCAGRGRQRLPGQPRQKALSQGSWRGCGAQALCEPAKQAHTSAKALH